MKQLLYIGIIYFIKKINQFIMPLIKEEPFLLLLFMFFITKYITIKTYIFIVIIFFYFLKKILNNQNI